MRIRPRGARIAGGLTSALIAIIAWTATGSITPAYASLDTSRLGTSALGMSAAPTTSALGMSAVPTDIGVGGDDGRDLYEGTGGLLVGGGYRGDDADRVESASCTECRWKLTAMCILPDHSPEDACPGSFMACPPGQLRVRVLLARPGQTWRVIGVTCLGPGGPVTVTDLVDRLRDLAVTRVPALRPGYQPVGRAVVGIPVILRAGQPRSLGARELAVLGHDVLLSATASWVWRYGDGESDITAKPGGVWPDQSVSHTYRRADTVRVDVTTVWAATFRVDGLGPFAVTGDIVRQDATLVFDVRPARAQLIVG